MIFVPVERHTPVGGFGIAERDDPNKRHWHFRRLLPLGLGGGIQEDIFRDYSRNVRRFKALQLPSARKQQFPSVILNQQYWTYTFRSSWVRPVKQPHASTPCYRSVACCYGAQFNSSSTAESLLSIRAKSGWPFPKQPGSLLPCV